VGHDLNVITVNICWEGIESAVAFLRKSFETGKSKGAKQVLKYRDIIEGVLSFDNCTLITLEEHHDGYISFEENNFIGEELPYKYFCNIQSKHPEITFIFDIVYSVIEDDVLLAYGRHFTVAKNNARLYNAGKSQDMNVYCEKWAPQNNYTDKKKYIKKWKDYSSDLDSSYGWLSLFFSTLGEDTAWMNCWEDYWKNSQILPKGRGLKEYNRLKEKGKLPHLTIESLRYFRTDNFEVKYCKSKSAEKRKNN